VTEPLTEAGRVLLREHSSGTPHMARHILAIEAEARATAGATDALLFEAMSEVIGQSNLPFPERVELRSRLLAALDEATPTPDPYRWYDAKTDQYVIAARDLAATREETK